MALPSIEQIKRALHLREGIEKLQAELHSIFGQSIPRAGKKAGDAVLGLVGLTGKKRRTMSRSARKKIAAAQRKRWAKVKAKGRGKAVAKAGRKKRGKMSAAGRAAIVAAQKARWARVKAEKEKAGK